MYSVRDILHCTVQEEGGVESNQVSTRFGRKRLSEPFLSSNDRPHVKTMLTLAL